MARDACFKVIGGLLARCACRGAAVAFRAVAGGAWLGHSGAYDLGCHWHSACCGRLIGRLIGRVWPPQIKIIKAEFIKAQIIQAQIIQERNAMTSLSLLALLGRIFDPLAALLDEAATSASAREAARVKLAAVKADAFSAALAFEEDRLATAARLVAAEAGGQSWLQRNWRPLTMLCFLFLVMADSFGLLAFRLSAEAWGLLQIGLGGYVVGRSVEKIAPQIKSSLNSKKG